MVGCVLAATSAYVAAAAAQPDGNPAGRAESAPGLQGWGKGVEWSSSQAAKDVGVWAVGGPWVLGMLGARSREVSVAPRRLGLAPVAPVTVVVKGKAHDVVTNAATVGELLSAMSIEPDGDDRIDPPPSTPLSKASRITFSRYGVRTVTTFQSLPVTPATTTTDRLPEGSLETVRAGRPARILRRYRVRLLNGRPVSRRLVFSRIVRAAVPGERLIGSALPAPVATSTGTTDSTVGEASWYFIDDGLSAASPWLPFGTHVAVTNLATGASVTVVINDRGPFGGRLIDLSEYAFSRIAPLAQGVCLVRISW
jgi:hypothetical protein